MSVYKIVVGDKFYFGSTMAPLKERIRTHKLDYERLTTTLYSAIKELGGWETVSVECVMECDNPKVEEDRLIREHWGNPLLLNERRAAVSDAEKLVENREYYARLKEQNPDKIKEYRSKAYQNRKTTEAYKTRVAAYRAEHRDELLERNRQRYASLTKEQKEERNKKNRDRYHAKKAQMLNTATE